MTTRTTLLSIGALGCWLRAHGRGRRAGEALLFLALGVPFIVAGTYHTASNYPAYTPSVATPPPVTPVAIAAATPPMNMAAQAQSVAAQRAAVARYPALGVAGTPFNRAFVAAYQQRRHTEPDYFDDPNWPIRLADEIALELDSAKPR